MEEKGILIIAQLRGGHVVAAYIRVGHDVLLFQHNLGADGGFGRACGIEFRSWFGGRFGGIAGTLVPQREVAHFKAERSILAQRDGSLAVQDGDEQREIVHAAGQTVQRRTMQGQVAGSAVNNQRIPRHFSGFSGQCDAVRCDARKRPEAPEIVDNGAFVDAWDGRA